MIYVSDILPSARVGRVNWNISQIFRRLTFLKILYFAANARLAIEIILLSSGQPLLRSYDVSK